MCKHEQAWGVPFSPQEFLEDAVKSGHPKSFGSIVPGILRDTIALNFSGDESKLVGMRAAFFKKWTSRALELQAQESEVKTNMPKHLQEILAPKRILVWKEMLEAYGYQDMEVVSEML